MTSVRSQGINQLLPSGETLLTALVSTPGTSNVGLVKHAICQGADVNNPNANGETPLAVGIRANDTDIVEALLQSGAQVNHASRFGFSPLQIALCENNTDMVKLLLRYAVNLNGFSITGLLKERSTDALILAMYWENIEILTLLLKQGAMVINGKIITTAVRSDKPDMLKTLLKYFKGSLSDFPNSISFLSLAACKHDCNAVRMLVAHGAKMEFDGDCMSDPEMASAQRAEIIANLRIAHPLAACIHYDCMPCFDLLLAVVSPNMDVNYKDQLFQSPLCYALLDSRWSCRRGPASAYLHIRHECGLTDITEQNRHTSQSFPLSEKRLEWAEMFIYQGANVDHFFRNPDWHFSFERHVRAVDKTLHLCLQAYQPHQIRFKKNEPICGDGTRISHIFRCMGLATDFKGVLLLYLSGYTTNRTEISRFSNNRATRQSVEQQRNIKTALELLISTPRTLQNIATISIRASLRSGADGRSGNIIFAAQKLHVPQVLRNQITLATTDGLVCENIAEQINSIHRN